MGNNKHSYATQRLYREEYLNIYELTPEEKVRLGLIKKPKVLLHKTQIVIPVHYGSSGVWWETRFIERADLPYWKALHPNLEVIG